MSLETLGIGKRQLEDTFGGDRWEDAGALLPHGRKDTTMTGPRVLPAGTILGHGRDYLPESPESKNVDRRDKDTLRWLNEQATKDATFQREDDKFKNYILSRRHSEDVEAEASGLSREAGIADMSAIKHAGATSGVTILGRHPPITLSTGEVIDFGEVVRYRPGKGSKEYTRDVLDIEER